MHLDVLYCVFVCGVIAIADCYIASAAQDGPTTELPPRPTFADVFQVEVQGIFQQQQAEMDGIIYYDKTRNRAAVSILYQNTMTKYFYFFDDDEMVSIDGCSCEVNPIPLDSNKSFFPFTIDEATNKKTIAPPEVFLRFSNSEFYDQDLALFPSYIYKDTMDVPQYERKNCKVTHIFSKPEVETPTCDGHACQPTIVAISVHCPQDEDKDEMDHVYDFYRYRTNINNERVFQTPAGIHCARKNTRPFPTPPKSFSFSYDFIERPADVEDARVIVNLHKKIWFDGNTKLARIDEFDDNGLPRTNRIFDYLNGAAYAIITASSECSPGPMDSSQPLDKLTELPSAIFPKDSSRTEEETVYIGKRQLHGLEYDVWSLSSDNTEEDLKIVKEMYFTNVIPNEEEIVTDPELQLSFAEFFSYGNDEGTLKLSMTTYIAINNFRTGSRDLSVFDVSQCLPESETKAFELNITGPDIMQNTQTYSTVLLELHQKLIEISGISVIRISELNGVFNYDRKLTMFQGLLLENPVLLGTGKNNSEPDLETAYKLLETEISLGNVFFCVDENEEKVGYKVISIYLQGEDVKTVFVKETVERTSGYAGGSLAAASIIMLLLGIMFGAIGYYVFLKRRKAPDELQLVSS